MSKDDFVCLGVFASAHGVKGDIHVKVFTELEQDIAQYGAVQTKNGAREFTLKILRVVKPGFVLARAPEINSREDAKALTGQELFVLRSVFPAPDEDEFYLDDLVGVQSFDENDQPSGEVVAVYNFGAGDILELKNVPGRKGLVMVPFIEAAVLDVDLGRGRISINSDFLKDDNSVKQSDETGNGP